MRAFDPTINQADRLSYTTEHDFDNDQNLTALTVKL